MKLQKQSDRKHQTRTKIQAGGLLQKSGLMDAFLIAPGDDLQDYQNLGKAAQLLGFLSACYERNTFNEVCFEEWRTLGEKLLKS